MGARYLSALPYFYCESLTSFSKYYNRSTICLFSNGASMVDWAIVVSLIHSCYVEIITLPECGIWSIAPTTAYGFCLPKPCLHSLKGFTVILQSVGSLALRPLDTLLPFMSVTSLSRL